jgi:GNAT superfamily N-acetyltransferase
MTYRIRGVDGFDDEIAETLAELHRMTFFDMAPIPNFDLGHWWIGYLDAEPVSFASVIPSDRYPRTGYFKRVGVLPAHRGEGLQARHMRAIDGRARRNGWTHIVSDTTDNPNSANNFIRSRDWRIFTPEHPWSFPHSIYWTKTL